MIFLHHLVKSEHFSPVGLQLFHNLNKQRMNKCVQTALNTMISKLNWFTIELPDVSPIFESIWSFWSFQNQLIMSCKKDICWKGIKSNENSVIFDCIIESITSFGSWTPINKSKKKSCSWLTTDQIPEGDEVPVKYEVAIIAADILAATFVPTLEAALSVDNSVEYQVL